MQAAGVCEENALISVPNIEIAKIKSNPLVLDKGSLSGSGKALFNQGEYCYVHA